MNNSPDCSAPRKDKAGVLSIWGVVFSGSYILASVVFWIIYAFERYCETEIPVIWVFSAIGFICFHLGLILSIVGTASSGNKKKGKKGALGIWGAGAGLAFNIAVVVIVIIGGISNIKRFEVNEQKIGQYGIRYKSDDNSQAEAVAYYWDGNPENNYIKLDYLDNVKIVRLYNFVVKTEESKNYYTSQNYEHYRNPLWGDPKLKERYLGIEPGTLIYHDTVIFTVEISKDIEEISMSTYTSASKPRELGICNLDGSISFYTYYFYFKVDNDNPNYYSKDGILYSKKNNMKVNAFYSSEDEPLAPRSSEIAPGETTETTKYSYEETTLGGEREILFGTGPERILLWSFSEEVPKMVQQYIRMNPEFGEKYSVECIVISDDAWYQSALDNAIVAGGDTAPDIYVTESAYVAKYTQGDMAKFAATYKDLGIDADTKIKEAGIAKYTVDIGTRNGEVVALGYQGSGGVMIYNSEVAKDVFGTDDPAEIEKIVGAGTGSWDKFFEAAEKLKEKGYAAVSGPFDIWDSCETSADTPWVVDNKLSIDPKRTKYLDLAKTIKDKGYSNGTVLWSQEWADDIKGEGEHKVFAYFKPAWFVSYIMEGQSYGTKDGEGTYGQWRVCAPPVGFFRGGSWILANRDSSENEKKGIAELIEWITLDTSETGLQYLWANGLVDWDYDPRTKTEKEAVASSTVMAKSDGTLEFCGGQNVFPVFITGNDLASANAITQYDATINDYFKDSAEQYVEGRLSREEAIKGFKKRVSDNISF